MNKMIDFFKKHWKKLVIIITTGIAGIIALLFFLPYIVSWFIPLPEKAKKEIEKLEQEITKLEEEHKKKEKTLENLIKENEKIKKDIYKQNQQALQLQIKLYKLLNGNYPDKKSIHKAITKRLIEPYSGKSTIYTDYNGKGGWYYDEKTGTIRANKK